MRFMKDVTVSILVAIVLTFSLMVLFSPAHPARAGYYSGSAAATVYPGRDDLRLTLTSGTPVTTSDVTTITSIYACPYTGTHISVYDGSAWHDETQATSYEVALGTQTSGTCVDIYAADNGGVPKFGLVAWTNSTTRATALAYQDGVLMVGSGATGHRYLGTCAMYASGTASTTATEDAAAVRALYNYYNRVPRSLLYTDPVTRTTTSSTYGQVGSTQVSYVTGVSEQPVTLTANSIVQYVATANEGIAIGSNATTVLGGTIHASSSANNQTVSIPYTEIPAAGFLTRYLIFNSGDNASTAYCNVQGVASGTQLYGMLQQ